MSYTAMHIDTVEELGRLESGEELSYVSRDGSEKPQEEFPLWMDRRGALGPLDLHRTVVVTRIEEETIGKRIKGKSATVRKRVFLALVR
ncbi:MAG: hypothetical protein US89_C0014G0022 [Candidatus Peregrinibacteria bacterium GW2011_GWF2_38_29]|nr:MAG: hypothetical protein US89_C0014G0022 [Candidatus Peregrinibacteria bacterium GW2011_GWF2_38_29]